jgi:hypothetical protein
MLIRPKQESYMEGAQVRAAMIAYLEDALDFAEQIKDATTGYLIERALDEARAKQFSSLLLLGELH